MRIETGVFLRVPPKRHEWRLFWRHKVLYDTTFNKDNYFYCFYSVNLNTVQILKKKNAVDLRNNARFNSKYGCAVAFYRNSLQRTINKYITSRLLKNTERVIKIEEFFSISPVTIPIDHKISQ